MAKYPSVELRSLLTAQAQPLLCAVDLFTHGHGTARSKQGTVPLESVRVVQLCRYMVSVGRRIGHTRTFLPTVVLLLLALLAEQVLVDWRWHDEDKVLILSPVPEGKQQHDAERQPPLKLAHYGKVLTSHTCRSRAQHAAIARSLALHFEGQATVTRGFCVQPRVCNGCLVLRYPRTPSLSIAVPPHTPFSLPTP